MKISFGNTFRLYCANDCDNRDIQQISSTAKNKGAQVKMYKPKDLNYPLHIQHPNMDYSKAAYLKYMQSIVVKDDKKLDNRIRRFCQEKGIPYTEMPENFMFNPKMIKTRMSVPSGLNDKDIRIGGLRYNLYDVDVEALKEYIKKNQPNNDFDEVEARAKEPEVKEKLQYLIGSGEFIPAPVLTCYSEDAIHFGYSKEKLANPLYFVLRDMGMKYIPTAMNQETRDMLGALGLIKHCAN